MGIDLLCVTHRHGAVTAAMMTCFSQTFLLPQKKKIIERFATHTHSPGNLYCHLIFYSQHPLWNDENFLGICWFLVFFLAFLTHKRIQFSFSRRRHPQHWSYHHRTEDGSTFLLWEFYSSVLLPNRFDCFNPETPCFSSSLKLLFLCAI